jgi:hypothetical protein
MDGFSGLEEAIPAKTVLKDVKYSNAGSVVLEILFVNPKSESVVPFARIENQLAKANLPGIKLLEVCASLLFF